MDVLHTNICSANMAAMVVCGAWTLWFARNARRRCRKTWEPGAAVRYISPMLEDLASLKPQLKPAEPKRKDTWKRPEQGWVKVNADAAFDAENHTGSAGVVIQDQDGLVVAAAARWLNNVPDALTVEALAVKEGLELASECG
jgi:hypothetical protein